MNLLIFKLFFSIALSMNCIESQYVPHGLRKIRIVAPSYKLADINTFNGAVARLRTDFATAEYSDKIVKDGALTVWRVSYPETPENRAIDLKDAIFNDTSKSIVWCLRGGRNSAEIFEFFPRDQNDQIDHQVVLIGFSDITALHYYMSLYYPKIKTIHGMVSGSVASASQAVNYLTIKDIMDGKTSKIVDIQPMNIIAANLLRLDNVTVLGGNLCLTQRSLKTYWQPDFTNKIVVLEEIDESPELVEIILNQIKTVGLFNNAKAIIFGQVYQSTVNNQISIQAETSKDELYVKDLEDLVNYYNTRMYLDLKIDYSGVASPNVAIYNFQDLQNKVGVEDLTPEEKLKLIISFKPTDSVTRLETALLQFYQSKYMTNATKITILWNPTSLQVQNKVEDTRTIDSVLREFAAKINLPVFKSNAFGHQSYNLPIPFGTSASLYSEKVSSCQGICSGFILEVKSPF